MHLLCKIHAAHVIRDGLTWVAATSAPDGMFARTVLLHPRWRAQQFRGSINIYRQQHVIAYHCFSAAFTANASIPSDCRTQTEGPVGAATYY